MGISIVYNSPITLNSSPLYPTLSISVEAPRVQSSVRAYPHLGGKFLDKGNKQIKPSPAQVYFLIQLIDGEHLPAICCSGRSLVNGVIVSVGTIIELNRRVS